MKHKWEVHTKCDTMGCPICDGGLYICKTCGLIEGALTTDCPGVQCYQEKAGDVYAGKIDFVNGVWVNSSSPHSPTRYK